MQKKVVKFKLIEFFLLHFLACSIELNLVKVFVALAEFECGKHWLGSDSGCLVWQKLLNLLCNTQKSKSIANYEEISLLVIQFVKKMIFCHAETQTKFALFIKKLIKDISVQSKFGADKSAATISGFLHQLIIQVLLDDQTILVSFERKSSLFKASCNSSLGLLTHPRFGTGNNCRLLELPLTKTCAQITQFISDIPLSQILSVAPTVGATPKTYENMNENVMEMKELLNKFKAFTDYDPGKSSAASSSKLEATLMNPNSQMNQMKYHNINKINLSVPKLKLFLKEASSEIGLSNEHTLGKVLLMHLARTKTRIAHDLTITVHYNPTRYIIIK